MFVCTNCGYLFEEPCEWEERHGFSHGPFERWRGCPKCYEPYVEAHKCDSCRDWIDGEYIKVGDKRYCSNCYIHYEIGEE